MGQEGPLWKGVGEALQYPPPSPAVVSLPCRHWQLFTLFNSAWGVLFGGGEMGWRGGCFCCHFGGRMGGGYCLLCTLTRGCHYSDTNDSDT